MWEIDLPLVEMIQLPDLRAPFCMFTKFPKISLLFDSSFAFLVAQKYMNVFIVFKVCWNSAGLFIMICALTINGLGGLQIQKKPRFILGCCCVIFGLLNLLHISSDAIRFREYRTFNIFDIQVNSPL
jgi:hypothetical protein